MQTVKVEFDKVSQPSQSDTSPIKGPNYKKLNGHSHIESNNCSPINATNINNNNSLNNHKRHGSVDTLTSKSSSTNKPQFATAALIYDKSNKKLNLNNELVQGSSKPVKSIKTSPHIDKTLQLNQKTLVSHSPKLERQLNEAIALKLCNNKENDRFNSQSNKEMLKTLIANRAHKSSSPQAGETDSPHQEENKPSDNNNEMEAHAGSEDEHDDEEDDEENQVDEEDETEINMSEQYNNATAPQHDDDDDEKENEQQEEADELVHRVDEHGVDMQDEEDEDECDEDDDGEEDEEDIDENEQNNTQDDDDDDREPEDEENNYQNFEQLNENDSNLGENEQIVFHRYKLEALLNQSLKSSKKLSDADVNGKNGLVKANKNNGLLKKNDFNVAAVAAAVAANKLDYSEFARFNKNLDHKSLNSHLNNNVNTKNDCEARQIKNKPLKKLSIKTTHENNANLPFQLQANNGQFYLPADSALYDENSNNSSEFKFKLLTLMRRQINLKFRNRIQILKLMFKFKRHKIIQALFFLEFLKLKVLILNQENIL